jgi:hypothetical protein
MSPEHGCRCFTSRTPSLRHGVEAKALELPDHTRIEAPAGHAAGAFGEAQGVGEQPGHVVVPASREVQARELAVGPEARHGGVDGLEGVDGARPGFVDSPSAGRRKRNQPKG